MQLLILLNLFPAAFAGGFSQKVHLHNTAVATTREHIQRIGEAQTKFKELIAECTPKNMTSQPELIQCGQRYQQLGLELRSLKNDQENTVKAVEALPADFAPAKESLRTTLKEGDKMISLLIETPAKLAATYYDATGVYAQKQFERTSHDALAQARLKRYCTDLQSQINLKNQAAQLSLTTNLPFPVLYKHQVSIQNTLAITTAVTSLCAKTYELTALTKTLKKLGGQLTPQHYSAYKKTICEKPKLKSQMSAKVCNALPLSPYTVQWLETSGGPK